MIDLLRRNFALKALSAMITAGLWFAVNMGGVTTRTYRVDVLVTDVLGDVVLMDEPEDVNLVVRGTSGAIRRINEEQIRTLEIGPVGPENTRWVIRHDSFNLPSGVEIQSIEPSTLRLNIQPMVEREFPVAANFRGQVDPGYEVLSAYVEPETLTIQMPESYLGELDTLHTEAIDLTGVVRGFSRPVRLLQHRRFIRFPSETPVTVHVEVGVVEDARVVETVPLVLTGPDADRCRVSTESLRLTVRGPRTLVEALDTTQVYASIACSEWTAIGPGVHSVEPRIENVPASLEVTRQPRVVRVTIEAPPAPDEAAPDEDNGNEAAEP